MRCEYLKIKASWHEVQLANRLHFDNSVQFAATEESIKGQLESHRRSLPTSLAIVGLPTDMVR